MSKLNPEIKKLVKSIVDSYGFFQKTIEEYENELVINTTNNNYTLFKYYVEIIERSYNQVVNDWCKDMVWQHIYHKEPIPDHWKKQITAEIDRWYYKVAQELNLIKE